MKFCRPGEALFEGMVSNPASCLEDPSSWIVVERKSDEQEEYEDEEDDDVDKSCDY